MSKGTIPTFRLFELPRRREKPRRGPLRDPGYLRFLREEGRCVACRFWLVRYGAPGAGTGYPTARTCSCACDLAHGPVNGKSSKGPDNEAIPLCRAHHDEQHRLGWPAFEAHYGFSWEREAAVWWAAWLIWREGLT